MTPTSQHQPALLLAISGPSSSGKTTLSRLLRDTLSPHAFILHEDDFYKTDTEIPVHDGLQDWDCLDSLDLPLLHKTLRHIQEQGGLPKDFESKEDKNAVGESGVDSSFVEACKARVQARLGEQGWSRPIAITDGFLLFSEDMKDIRDLFNVKLFLRTSYETAKKRREARKGYVTLEGFWEDPPGYVDKIVWPNYVKDHKFLFKDRDVEGEFDQEKCGQLRIEDMPAEYQGSMTKVLRWAVDIVEQTIAYHVR